MCADVVSVYDQRDFTGALSASAGEPAPKKAKTAKKSKRACQDGQLGPQSGMEK